MNQASLHIANAPAIIRAFDAINRVLGNVAGWAMLPVVLICFSVVILRYGFGLGYVWLQELFVWINGAAFLSAAAYGFQEDVHVRVDIFYARANSHQKAWINIAGVVFFLFVTCGALFYLSFPQVVTSWRLGERSESPFGLGHAYLLKSFVLLFCVICILHGIVLLWKSWVVLRSPSGQGPSRKERE